MAAPSRGTVRAGMEPVILVTWKASSGGEGDAEGRGSLVQERGAHRCVRWKATFLRQMAF